MPFMPRRKDQLEILGRIGLPPVRVQIADAWAFQRYCAPRLWLPLSAVWGGLLVALPLLLIPAGVFILAAHRFHSSFLVLDPLSWPLLFQLGVLFAMVLPGLGFALASHLSFIMVQRVRRKGRYTRKSVGRDLSMAIERTIHIGTLPWIFVLTLVMTILLLVGHGVHLALEEDLGRAGSIIAALVSVLFFTGLLVLPQLGYQFATLVRRDCGWGGAWDVSQALFVLESRGGLVKSAWSFLMIFSLVGMPGGIALFLATAERLDLLLSAILGEKTRHEIQKALSEEEPWNPTVLKPYFELLDRGRYLDALNGFQEYLYRHPMDIDAMRGQALAYLHMGHPKAREALERWNTEDPDSEQAITLLGELNTGRWSEGGDRLATAQKNCTQPLGRGV